MNKAELKAKAIQHHQDMLKLPLATNIIYTEINRNSDMITSVNQIPEISITDCDTVSEIIKHEYNANNLVCALNFASFTEPGGGFLNGAMAQEEALCHASNLYESISKEIDFYDYNSKHKNNGAYLNRAIFSREVTFIVNNKQYKCDVLTCACPNLRPVKVYGAKQTFNNSEILKSRIKFILDVAEEECVNTLILGAWGCGVFMQDPSEVASIFKELLQDKYYQFDKVIFAIPSGTNNVEFKKVFNL